MRKRGSNKLGRKLARQQMAKKGFFRDANGNVNIRGAMGRRNYEAFSGNIEDLQPEGTVSAAKHTTKQLQATADRLEALSNERGLESLKEVAQEMRGIDPTAKRMEQSA